MGIIVVKSYGFVKGLGDTGRKGKETDWCRVYLRINSCS